MIPQIEPWIDETELKQLKEVIGSTWITEGKKTKEFEEKIASYTKAKHAISACNGTVALYMCFKALGIKEGDEVIVPDLTFIATANSVFMAGGMPVLADVDAKNLNLDPSKIEGKITPRTKAIMPVHLYGRPARMDEINEIARRHNLFVVEDAAQGIGVSYKGKHVGILGDLGVLSFYGNKTITSGEGGMVLTNDDNLAKKCWMLKNHGREVKGSFIHPSIGYNFCMTDLQAAVGLAQFSKLPEIIRRKKRNREHYENSLSSLPTISFQEAPSGCVDLFTNILLDKPEKLALFLEKQGVQTRRFFYPLHKQPAYKHLKFGSFPTSSHLYDHGLSLPSSATLTPEDIDFVCEKIKLFFKS